MEIAACRARGQRVDDDAAVRKRVGIDFLFRGIVGTDGGDEQSRVQMGSVARAAERSCRLHRCRSSNGRIEIGHGLDGIVQLLRHAPRQRRSLGHIPIEDEAAGNRSHHRHGAQLGFPCSPHPTTVIVLACDTARCVAANAATAAVRMLVKAIESMIASGRPSSPSSRISAP